jgi:hypothetical protein
MIFYLVSERLNRIFTSQLGSGDVESDLGQCHGRVVILKDKEQIVLVTI